jgi:hypothetical protein
MAISALDVFLYPPSHQRRLHYLSPLTICVFNVYASSPPQSRASKLSHSATTSGSAISSWQTSFCSAALRVWRPYAMLSLTSGLDPQFVLLMHSGRPAISSLLTANLRFPLDASGGTGAFRRRMSRVMRGSGEDGATCADSGDGDAKVTSEGPFTLSEAGLVLAILDTSFAPGVALTSCDGSPSNVVVSARTVGDPTKKKTSEA